MSTTARFAALALIVAFGLAGASVAFNDAALTYSVGGEEITQDVGGDVEVPTEGEVVNFYDNETVYNSTGTVLEEGTDYDWDTQNGSVHFYDTESTSDGSIATVDYAYDAVDEDTSALAGVLNYGFYALLLGVVFIGGAKVVTFITGGT